MNTYKTSYSGSKAIIKELNKLYPNERQLLREQFGDRYSEAPEHGLFIYINNDTEEKDIINFSIESTQDIQDQIYIYIGKGSKGTIYESLVDKYKLSRKTKFNVKVDSNAQLDFFYIQDIDLESDIDVENTFQVCGNAVLNVNYANFGAKKLLHKHKSITHEKGISNINHIFFLHKDQEYTIDNGNIFEGAEGGGEIILRGALDDNAKAMVDGKIHITQNGGGTHTYLTEDVLLLSDKSNVIALPNLEIDTNDVKASHGVSISTIDDKDIFYAQSRGISKKDAREMMTKGFLIQDFGDDDNYLHMKKIALQSISDKFAKRHD